MYKRDPSQPFDARLEGRGFYAAGPSVSKQTTVKSDSPTEGVGDGPLAPEPLPGGVEGGGEFEMRAPDADARVSDVDEFKRMEENAEDGRE
jgi:hypothetical protein